MSFSAPSAINLDFSQVKFEDETHDWFDESLPNKSLINHRYRYLIFYILDEYYIIRILLKFAENII